MKWLTRLMVVVLVVFAFLMTVELFHTRGISGAFDDWFGDAPPPADFPVANGDGTGTNGGPAEPPKPKTRGPGAAAMLSAADAAYDRGEFSTASSNYLAAKALAADDAEEERVVRGLHRALLAWAVTRDAPKCLLAPKDAAAECAKRISAAEHDRTEEAWLDALRFAAGAGLRERMPYLAGQLLDVARSGGHVSALATDTLPLAGARARDLALAIEARGLGRPPIPPETTAGGEEPSGIGGRDPRDDEPSGIGGVGQKGVPLGGFSSEMRRRLREAIAFQRAGEREYRLASPDNPDRVAHRRKALDALRAAREIYLEAEAEDPKSSDLQTRIHDVTLLIAQLRKDQGLGEK